MDREAIRWGIIGVGRFGRVHAQALRSIPGCQLEAICHHDAERLSVAGDELRVARRYVSHEELLADSKIDAVSITTHWEQHFEIARAALDSGKHVLLEKPMATTVEECRELVEAAATSSGRFMVGHICRFDPRVSLAKQAIDAGRIGRIVTMHAKRNLPQAAGSLRLDKISPLMGDGVHDADLMMWFMESRPQRVYGRQLQFLAHRYPDVGWAMLEFGDTALGVVETNWGLPKNVSTTIDAVMQVVGTEGMLTIDCAQTGLEILDAGGSKRVDTVYWPESHEKLVGVLRDELQYFVSCIREARPPRVVTPMDALRAVEVMAAAEASAAQGVPLELK